MLSFSFYPQNAEPGIPQTAEPDTLSVSEAHYERLARAGLARLVPFEPYDLNVDDELCNGIKAVKLSFEMRRKLLDFLEAERHKELLALFAECGDIDSMESREKLEYVKLLTNLYERIKNEQNRYFSPVD
ncbi:MAG: hypothetical protein IJR54_04865 [Oscillibacter sp.]|nr:hypothetical protein [Oscillibacter sp.]